MAELEAESVAYIILNEELGLDSSEYSFGYVVTWAGGGESAITSFCTGATDVGHAGMRRHRVRSAPTH